MMMWETFPALSNTALMYLLLRQSFLLIVARKKSVVCLEEFEFFASRKQFSLFASFFLGNANPCCPPLLSLCCGQLSCKKEQSLLFKQHCACCRVMEFALFCLLPQIVVLAYLRNGSRFWFIPMIFGDVKSILVTEICWGEIWRGRVWLQKINRFHEMVLNRKKMKVSFM